MPHQYWLDYCAPIDCEYCNELLGGCKTDMNITCSPDCEDLLPDGEPSHGDNCKDCDALDGLELNRHR